MTLPSHDLLLWPRFDRLETNRVRTALHPDSAGVLVLGPSGVGKTDLIDTAVRSLPSADGRIVFRASSGDLTPLSGVDPAPTGNGPRPLLWIDDVDRLAEGLATSLSTWCRSGQVTVALTARSAAMLPGSIAALWLDDVVDTVHLEPIAPNAIETILGNLLGAPVDHGTARNLWRATAGNLHLLRSAIDDRHDAQTLAEGTAMLSWPGDVAAGPRTRAVVAAQLATATRPQRAALELVGLAQPVPMALALTVLEETDSGTDALDGLLVEGTIVEDCPGGDLRLREPLTATALRHLVPPGRRRRLFEALIASAPPTADTSHQARTVRWALDCGLAPSPNQLRAAARAAARLGDDVTVIELAGALIDQEAAADGPDVEARLLRADAARTLGRVDLARRDLHAAARQHPRDESTGQEHRLMVAHRQADLAQYVDDDPNLALEILRTVRGGSSVRASIAVQVDMAVRSGWAGRFSEAVPASLSLLDRRDLTTEDRLHLVTPAALGLGAQGRFNTALTLLDGHRHMVDDAAVDALWARGQLRAATFQILLTSGRVADAARHMAVAETSDERDVPALRHLGRGQLAIAQVRWDAAVRHLRIAVEALRRDDLSGFLALATTSAAFATAMAGQGPVAERLHRDAEAIPLRSSRALFGLIELTRARTAVALQLDLAPADILGMAEQAGDRGEAYIELQARHLHAWACRRDGGPNGDRGLVAAVTTCAAAVDDPVGSVLASHTEVLLTRPDDHAALANAVSRLGIALPSPSGVSRLTSRQGEVARLAAGGLSSRDIAEQLYISVRTVDAHLRQVFTALGVNRRRDLATALAGHHL